MSLFVECTVSIDQFHSLRTISKQLRLDCDKAYLSRELYLVISMARDKTQHSHARTTFSEFCQSDFFPIFSNERRQ